MAILTIGSRSHLFMPHKHSSVYKVLVGLTMQLTWQGVGCRRLELPGVQRRSSRCRSEPSRPVECCWHPGAASLQRWTCSHGGRACGHGPAHPPPSAPDAPPLSLPPTLSADQGVPRLHWEALLACLYATLLHCMPFRAFEPRNVRPS